MLEEIDIPTVAVVMRHVSLVQTQKVSLEEPVSVMEFTHHVLNILFPGGKGLQLPLRSPESLNHCGRIDVRVDKSEIPYAHGSLRNSKGATRIGRQLSGGKLEGLEFEL